MGIVLSGAASDGVTRGEGSVMIGIDFTHPDINEFYTGGIGGGTPTGGLSVGLAYGKSEGGLSGVDGESINAGGSYGPVGVDHSYSTSSDITTISVSAGSSDLVPEGHATVTNTVSETDIIQNVEDKWQNTKDQIDYEADKWYEEQIKKGLPDYSD